MKYNCYTFTWKIHEWHFIIKTDFWLCATLSAIPRFTYDTISFRIHNVFWFFPVRDDQYRVSDYQLSLLTLSASASVCAHKKCLVHVSFFFLRNYWPSLSPTRDINITIKSVIITVIIIIYSWEQDIVYAATVWLLRILLR